MSCVAELKAIRKKRTSESGTKCAVGNANAIPANVAVSTNCIRQIQTRRVWIWRMQFVLSATFAGIALALPTAHFVPLSLVLFFLIAFSSATHDIAADGFYILALSEGQQSFFVGVRNTLYRVAS